VHFDNLKGLSEPVYEELEWHYTTLSLFSS
jgi:hypothetical protein